MKHLHCDVLPVDLPAYHLAKCATAQDVGHSSHARLCWDFGTSRGRDGQRTWLNYFSSQGEAMNTENLPEREHLPETDFAFTFGFYFGTARV